MEKLYYRFIKLELEQFAIFEENISNEFEDVELQLQTDFSYNKNDNVIISTIHITMVGRNNPLLKAVSAGYFKIQEESLGMLSDGDGKIKFTPAMLIQFASLNYGSLRGMLHMKTRGTPLSDYILPPVYFDEIITDSFIVE